MSLQRITTGVPAPGLRPSAETLVSVTPRAEHESRRSQGSATLVRYVKSVPQLGSGAGLSLWKVHALWVALGVLLWVCLSDPDPVSTMKPRENVRVRVLSQKADAGHDDVAHLSAGQRLELMWQLTLDAWAFKGEPQGAESRLQRHVVRIQRGGR
jgi:hypothetical protein